MGHTPANEVLMDNILKSLPERLLPWFEVNKRDLPWRRDREAYHVWLSEIMLQQTRVEAVKGYYARFLEALPTIEALAHAPDDRLRKLWEGLGYYNRVMNLKKAAVVIMTEFGGQFPEEHEKILGLPGIGDYTAGAIASIAFGQKKAAVDGNVLRVLSRLLNEDVPIDLPKVKASARDRLEEIYPEDAGSFTQALMELGATVCTPNGAPLCEQCPLADLCKAKHLGIQRELPKKLPKKPKKQEAKTVFILSCDGRIALERRQDTGLLAGLWQFPNVEGHLDEQAALEQAAGWGLHPKELLRRADREHIFTHIRWELRAYRIDCGSQNEAFSWLTPEGIEKTAALPTAFRQFWDLVKQEG